MRIVKRRMHEARVDVTPAIPESVRVETAHMKTFAATPLECRRGIVLSVNEEVDGLAAQLSGVKPIEENRPTAALGMSDFADKDRFARRLRPAITLKKLIAHHLD